MLTSDCSFKFPEFYKEYYFKMLFPPKILAYKK